METKIPYLETPGFFLGFRNGPGGGLGAEDRTPVSHSLLASSHSGTEHTDPMRRPHTSAAGFRPGRGRAEQGRLGAPESPRSLEGHGTCQGKSREVKTTNESPPPTRLC